MESFLSDASAWVPFVANIDEWSLVTEFWIEFFPILITTQRILFKQMNYYFPVLFSSFFLIITFRWVN